jgi:hypothetical protein
MERTDLIRNVLRAAGEFHALRLWKQFDNRHCFGVRLPAPGGAWLGVVMGRGGQEYGLSLYGGPAAADCIVALSAPEGPGDDCLADTDMLGFSMERFDRLPSSGRALFGAVERYPRQDEIAPSFVAKPAGRQPRLPQDSELEHLLWILGGVVEAARRRLLKPARLDDVCGISILTLGGSPENPAVKLTREPWPRPALEIPSADYSAESAPLRGLPQLATTWLAGLLPLPVGVADDDREPLLLLVAEDGAGAPGAGEADAGDRGEGGRVLQAQPVMPDQFGQAIQGMVAIFRGRGPLHEKGLPREIHFSSRKLCSAMTGILAPLGVGCHYQPDLPQLRQVGEDFFRCMDETLAADTRKRRAAGAAPTPVPAPDDLAGWKDVDRELAGRFADRLGKKLRGSSRAAQQHFGAADIERLLEEHQDRLVLQSYAVWAILHYRATKGSRTQAEKLLAQGLPEAEGLLLRARLESYPSLYRVAHHDPKAGTIDLEDVLLGGTVVVHDRLMAENIDDGLFLCARLFAAGQFHFLDPAGPPLGAAMGAEAVEFLQESGVELTPAGLRRDAHKFGWLWAWSERWESRLKSMRLANMDGDELLWHTASFAVSDLAEVRRALLAHKDLEQEDGDAFLWLQKRGRAAQTMGGPVHLARIELLGEELILTVNSARRFARGRKWLEQLPGVVFRNVTTRPWDEAAEDRPLDERIAQEHGAESVEITPEMAQSLQQMMDRHYMGWLDRALPVLHGQSPRQACQTAAGRQQVTMLIRTMPDPLGPAPVQAPRQAMSQALGLEEEVAPGAVGSSPELPWAEPPRPRVSTGKVGRNDPCPCGSGKKYKKCCGK